MAEKIVLFEADIKMDQAILDTAKLKEETQRLKDISDSYKGTLEENSAAHVKAQAAYKASAAELKSNETNIIRLTSANKDNAGTITKLEAENTKLRLSQKGLNLETKEGILKNKEINAKINENTEFIKKNVDANTKNKMSIGGYVESLESMNNPLINGAKGFMGMAKAAWAFVATPVGAIIAAIVIVLTAIVNIFKKFEPLLEWFEQKIAAVSAVLSVLKDAFLSFFSGTKSLTEAFSGLGSSMRDAANRAIELKKAQQELEDQQILMIETEAKQKRQIDELLLQSKNRTLSEKERMALIDQALKIEEEAYNKKKQLGDAEYSQAVEQIAIDNRLTAEQKKNLQEQGAAYLQKLQETKSINDEEVKAFAELSAKRETILNESIAIREKAMNRQDALAEKLAAKEQKRIDDAKAKADKKAEEENKAYEKAVADAEKLNQQYLESQQKMADLEREIRLQAFEKGKQDRKNQKQWERDRLAIDLENEMQLRMLNNESAFEILRDDLANRTAAELESAETTGANILLIQQKYSSAKIAIDRAELLEKLTLWSGFTGNVAELFGKGAKVGKMAASTQAAISATQGAISAYSAAQIIPPPAGQIIGGINAGLVAAMGIKSVKDIWAVKSGLPGDSGGGSASGIASPAPPGGASVNPSIGNGIVSRSVAQKGGDISVTTQPTLVVDRVTEAQQQQNRINQTQAI